MPKGEPRTEPGPIALDTSVVVAGLLEWHEHYEESFWALDSVLEDGVIVSSRVLIESYSVMTRMPAPHRLAPADALRLLTETLSEHATVADLPAEERWSFLAALAELGVAGGSAYDAEILATARHAGAKRLLTLNRRHFEPLAPPDLEVISPL